jgi:photosystem II stability/assembly factor-like uncharacterized protein
MKLLAPGVGWVLQQNHLYWTKDNGHDWTDITPIDAEHLDAVYFLDESHGWAVFSRTGGADAPQASINIASTTNGGEAWQISTFASEILPKPETIGGVASLSFVDPRHGWLVLHLVSSSNFSFGALLKTEDGGTTWVAMPSPPAAGTVSFRTAQEGWLVGGPVGDRLWATLNGGESWQERSTPVPISQTNCHVKYDLPVFSGQEGILIQTNLCSGNSYGVEYTTHDDGKSWNIENLTESGAIQRGSVISSVAGSHTVQILRSSEAGVTIQTPQGAKAPALPSGIWPEGSVVQSDFVDDSNGWMVWSASRCAHFKSDCSQQVELLSTAHGAQSLVTITPAEQVLPKSLQGGDLIQANPAAAGAYVQTYAQTGSSIGHAQGFDTSCVPSATEMQAWLTYAPYQDAAIYIGGINVSCKASTNVNLNTAWVERVSSMGWNFIPLWVGPQSQCVIVKTGTPQTDFNTLIASDPVAAKNQGISEAKAAVGDTGPAKSLGITGIIYYDLENYNRTKDPSGASCSTSAEQFLAGWVGELKQHLDANNQPFKAGLYSSSANFAQDYVGSLRESGKSVVLRGF